MENFPGYPDGITGPELMEDLKKQAVRFGADIRFGIATAADLGEAPYKITIDGEKVIETETLIIATGASAGIWVFRMSINMRVWVYPLALLAMVSSIVKRR